MSDTKIESLIERDMECDECSRPAVNKVTTTKHDGSVEIGHYCSFHAPSLKSEPTARFNIGNDYRLASRGE